MKKGNKSYSIGLSKPIIAKYVYDETTQLISYTDAFRCGEAVQAQITPAYVSAQLYGDNKIVDEVNEFKNAAITMGSTTMPWQAPKILFGHDVDNTTGVESAGANDVANYVGQAFVVKNSNGKYDALILPKVRYTEGAENFQTKGDSVSYVTPQLAGTAFPRDTDDVWRVKNFGFDSEDAAIEWIETTMGISLNP